ncbi:MAG: hypothetical protein KKD44_28525 [Proteobacteria bacterium]|nr:hypothetical protein [Pseudomonadota bacterium]
MKVNIENSVLGCGWSGFRITDDDGNEIILTRGDTESLALLIRSVLDLEQEQKVERFRCPSPDEILVEELLAALKEMCNGPHSSLVDCPADISDSPCICGWHDAKDKALALINRVEGR